MMIDIRPVLADELAVPGERRAAGKAGRQKMATDQETWIITFRIGLIFPNQLLDVNFQLAKQ